MNPAAIPAQPSLARGAYGALLVLTLINLVNYLDRYVLAGMLPLVQAHFGKTDAEMGILSSSFLLVYAMISPFTGYLGDRFPRRWFIGGGVILWSGATVWSGLAGSFGELLLARSLIGVGEAGYAAVAPGFIADLFDERRRGRMLSLFYAALPVGSALGFTLGGAIGTAYGWRSAFYVAGIPGAILGVAALLMREPRRGQSDHAPLSAGQSPAAEAAPSVRTILLRLARTQSYLVLCSGYTASTFAMGGLAAWWPTFLYRERGIPLDRGGFLFGAILVVAGFLGTLSGGWLGDRINLRNKGGYFLSAGWGLILAAPFSVVAIVAPDPSVFWPAIFAALFFLFFNTGPLNAALVNVIPASMRASAVAVNVFVIHMLGDAISPWLIGRISDASSLGHGVLLTCFMMALAGLILVSGSGVLRRELTRPNAGSA